MILLFAHPLIPPPVSKLDQRHSGTLRKRDNLLTGEGVEGWARSRIIRPQKNLGLYKSFNTLWTGRRGEKKAISKK
jgi:hypothetical protein